MYYNYIIYIYDYVFLNNEMNISLYISCICKILTNELQNIMSYQGAIKLGCKYVTEDGASLLGFTKNPRSSSSVQTSLDMIVS